MFDHLNYEKIKALELMICECQTRISALEKQVDEERQMDNAHYKGQREFLERSLADAEWRCEKQHIVIERLKRELQAWEATRRPEVPNG